MSKIIVSHLRSSFVVLTTSSASLICSSKLLILVPNTSGDSAPNIMDDNPLNEKPLDLGGAWPLSIASCSKTNSYYYLQSLPLQCTPVVSSWLICIDPSLVPRRSILTCCQHEVWERAGESSWQVSLGDVTAQGRVRDWPHWECLGSRLHRSIFLTLQSVVTISVLKQILIKLQVVAMETNYYYY